MLLPSECLLESLIVIVGQKMPYDPDSKGVEGRAIEEKGLGPSNSNSGESKDEGKDDDLEIFKDDSKEVDPADYPGIEVTDMVITPSKKSPVDEGLEVKIVFELDRDVIAGFWSVKFLVDSSDNRIIKILGETEPEDYPSGESDMYFSVDRITVDDIPPSTLTNSGLLMCCFMADGVEVATVNSVVNVFKDDSGNVMREILNPLG